MILVEKIACIKIIVNQFMNFKMVRFFYFDFPQFIFNIVNKPKYLKFFLPKQTYIYIKLDTKEFKEKYFLRAYYICTC